MPRRAVRRVRPRRRTLSPEEPRLAGKTGRPLVPNSIKAVPADPYDGKPLRYRRLSDGVVVYALGFDRKDNGGRYHRTFGKSVHDRRRRFRLPLVGRVEPQLPVPPAQNPIRSDRITKLWSSGDSTMLTIHDGRCTRRSFLQIGGLGLAGLTLADLLRVKAHAPTRGRTSSRIARSFSCSCMAGRARSRRSIPR